MQESLGEGLFWFVFNLKLLPLHIPLLPPFLARIAAVHLTLYQLSLVHIGLRQLLLNVAYIAFIALRPSTTTPSFTVIKWQQRILHSSYYIIVDSLQEHPR